jgi:hypothetical protein
MEKASVYKYGMSSLAILLAGFLSASESWTMENPYAFAREKEAVKLLQLSDGAIELRHAGGADWAVNGFPRIAVKHGDTFEVTCGTAALADVPDSCPVGLGAVLRDENGKEVSWSFGTVSVKPGNPIKAAFMVPSGVATIQPRVTGRGVAGVRLRDVFAVRTGNILQKDSPMSSCLFTNAFLRGSVTGAGFEVEDIRTGRKWKPAESLKLAGDVISCCQDNDGDIIRVDIVIPTSMKRWYAEYNILKDSPEVVVTVGGGGEMSTSLDYPTAFASQKGDRLIVPMNEGICYPADESDEIPGRLIAYGGHGICMAFFGVQDDATGAGWMAIIETPDDASMIARRDAETKLWALGPSWDDQKKRFGYVRRVRYIFFDKGGYVAMCKRYRAYVKDIGKLKTFSEKAKERPLVDRLLGAPNIWTWEKDKLAVVSNLVSAGIDRFLWSGGGSPEEVVAMAAMPNVLVGRYDIYQDVYHPDQLQKLGRKSGPNTEAWPKDIVWNSADSNDWRHAWGVQAKDGTWTYCAMMCDSAAPAYERCNVAKELKTKPYNARFIDTTVASPWQTCWNPAHPMTRSDSRHWKMELLRILGDEFKLVVGSETGHDASVPYCDYFEGMLSLGPYRVPDSGRNMIQVWTNVPERVEKYQVGEKYRLPLWELVYHDCVCAHWYWGDYNNKLPDIWWKRDLFNVLYGTMGMYLFNNRIWADNKERFVRSYRMTSPVARATGYSEMVDHRILSANRTVQQSSFANGTVVTVNFGDAPFELSDGTLLPARAYHVVPLSAASSSGVVENSVKQLEVLMLGNSFSICNLSQMPKVAAGMGKKAVMDALDGE